MFTGWSTGRSFMSAFNRVTTHVWPLSSLYLAPSLPSVFPSSMHPAFSILLFLSNKHTGWECRLKSSAVCNERHVVQNLVMMLFSPAHLDSSFPFCVSSPPLLPLKHCSHSSSTFRHSSAPGECGGFSPRSHLYTRTSITPFSSVSLNLLLFS